MELYVQAVRAAGHLAQLTGVHLWWHCKHTAHSSQTHAPDTHTHHHTPPVGAPHSVAHARHLTPTCRWPVAHQFRTLLTATDAKSAPCPHSSPPPPSLRAVAAGHSVCSMQGVTARQARDTEHIDLGVKHETPHHNDYYLTRPAETNICIHLPCQLNMEYIYLFFVSS